MDKRIFIIHGWEANPAANWLPWLRKELEAKGFYVKVPVMPNTMHPTLDGWLSHLREAVSAADKNTYFVGHSLGVITILRYLESLPSGQKAGGAILVAGFPEPIGYKEIDGFFQKPLDYQKIINSVNKIVAINSDNDPYVPIRTGELLRDKLSAEFIVLRNAGHITAGDGFTELPVVLEKMLNMTK